MVENTFELYGKYKNLYLFNSGKGSVLFRTLSYSKLEDSKRISKTYPALAPVVEDSIWEECVIEHTLPGTVDSLPAGIISTIVRLIIGFSGPSNQEEIDLDVSEIREEAHNIREDVIIKICQAFPSYTPEDVEAMEWKTQLRRLVQAEKVLNTKFSFVGPDDAAPAGVTEEAAPKMKEVDGEQYIDFAKENQVLMGN
jgi:hypothetical protein